QRLDRLHQAVAEWSEQYEYVLVDLPPLLLSAEAEMLIETMGQVFLLVEAQAVNRGEISRAKRLLQKIDPQAVGLFVNKVPLSRGSGHMEHLIIETISRSQLSRFRRLAEWKLRWEMWLTERSMRQSEKARDKKQRPPSARSDEPRATADKDLPQELTRQAQQAQQAGKWAEASQLMLELAYAAPSADSQFNAAQALLTQLEHSEWDAGLARLARDCMQQLKALEGASARVDKLCRDYQQLEERPG
ncbi:MAG: hypothetical protein RLZZ22_943, partial [Pseudomonadota bacterium]